MLQHIEAKCGHAKCTSDKWKAATLSHVHPTIGRLCMCPPEDPNLNCGAYSVRHVMLRWTACLVTQAHRQYIYHWCLHGLLFHLQASISLAVHHFSKGACVYACLAYLSLFLGTYWLAHLGGLVHHHFASSKHLAP